MQRHGTRPNGPNTTTEPASDADSASRRTALGQALTVLSGGAVAVALPIESRAQLSNQGDRLVLQNRDLGRRMNDLFAEIRKDKAREREFIENPVGVLGNRLSPRRFQGISPKRLANANRILYALLANDQFLGWLRGYVKDMEGAKTDRGKVTQDFAAALARYADPDLLQGMLEDEASRSVGPDKTPAHLTIGYECFLLYYSYGLRAKEGGEMLSPAEMRALTDILAEKVAARARELKASGALQQQIIELP